MVFGGVPDGATQGDTYSLQLDDDLGRDVWWTVRMKSIKYGESDDADNLVTSGLAYTILDSGTSLIYLETADYYNFVDKLQASQPAFDCSGLVCTAKGQRCGSLTSSMESLSFELGSGSNTKYYTLPPAAYAVSQIVGVSSEGTTYSCEVMISKMDGNCILGDTFMRNFVTSFNYRTGGIKLAINAYAPTGLTIGSEPGVSDDNMTDKTAGWIIFLAVLGGIILVALIAWMVLCLVKRQRKRRLTLAHRSIGAVKSPANGSGGEIQEEQSESFVQSGTYKNHWSSKKLTNNI